ncbi:MAG: hypothetical protein FJZ09_01065 [Candidatus Omnitrophica bacterium]|nr:hypothetical protein [Candidatus Omnitrophota bacterium]
MIFFNLSLRKKLLILFLVFVLLASIATIYLNSVILPTRIKSLIVARLKEATGKEVALYSLEFSVFKGLVLRDLLIYDEKQVFLSVKESSCTFLVWPIFKKAVIIPTVTFKSPRIFIERKSDNTFNLEELLPKAKAAGEKPEFNVYIYRVSVRNAYVQFKDSKLAEPAVKELKDLDLNMSLALPASVRFSLKALTGDNAGTHLALAGEYRIPGKHLKARAAVRDLSPLYFAEYYRNSGVVFSGGLINALVNLELEDGILYAGIGTQNKDITFLTGNTTYGINSEIAANLQYVTKDKGFGFSAKARVFASRILGLGLAGDVSGINGEITFNNSGIFSDNLRAEIWGLPVLARGSMRNFAKPSLDVNITTTLTLAQAKALLKEKMKFNFPGEMSGSGSVFVAIRNPEGKFQVTGALEVSGALARLEKAAAPFENISGRIEFAKDALNWPRLSFIYQGVSYRSSGEAVNPKNPAVHLTLASKDLSLESSFTVGDERVDFSRFTGRYLSSQFNLTGSALKLEPSKLNLTGYLDLDTEDLGRAFKKYKETLDKLKLKGKVRAELKLSGNAGDLKTVLLDARITGPEVSLYGLTARDLSLYLNQHDDLLEVPFLSFNFYDGKVQAQGKLGLGAEPSFSLSADISGVRIEKLKNDTPIRDKDIAGLVNASFNAAGDARDFGASSGSGRVTITEGRLWQLNLFKGLGSFLFAKDFASIVFNEGFSDFIVADRSISTENLTLKSNICELTGPVRLGFDGAIDAVLDVHILDEMVPLTGTFKDIATAIVGKADKFAEIRISGTLKEPKYKFRTAVGNIIRSLKDVLLGN